jgi:hypothetical protein
MHDPEKGWNETREGRGLFDGLVNDRLENSLCEDCVRGPIA